MSKFLGPIHFWVYKKIQLQQGIINNLLTLFGDEAPDFRRKLDLCYGKSVTQPLEEVIDAGNIHGWLQENVTREEYKLAASVTTLLDKSPDDLNNITAIFFETGRNLCPAKPTALSVYQILNDSLLDGMPCDHANTLIEGTDEQVIWKRNTCVHGHYWSEVGGDISCYYALRDALIEGLLEKTDFIYEKTDDVTFTIRRKTQ